MRKAGPRRYAGIRWLLLPLAVLILLLGLTLLPRLQPLAPAPAEIGGPFTLTDQQGRTVNDSDFRGKLMMVYFGYSFCPDVCPTTLNQMAQVYNQLAPAEQSQITPIFITVDPERDTVAQMAQYVANFSPALVGLTGTPLQVAIVTKAYHVYARKTGDGANYGVDHSSVIYLMGKDGHFIRHFDSNASNQDITDGLKKALAS